MELYATALLRHYDAAELERLRVAPHIAVLPLSHLAGLNPFLTALVVGRATYCDAII